jgi:hypothetical protein
MERIKNFSYQPHSIVRVSGSSGYVALLKNADLTAAITTNKRTFENLQLIFFRSLKCINIIVFKFKDHTLQVIFVDTLPNLINLFA